MSFSISAAEDVISKEQAELLSCLYLTFKQVFKEVALIPGFTIHFIGSNSPGLLTEDPEILSKRIKQRNLPTKYINDYYLRFRMSPERLQYLHHAVKADASVLLNRDFHPISYFYSLYLWLANFNKKMIGSIENIFQLKIFYYYFLLLIFFLVGIYFYSGRQKIEKLTARAIYVSMILIGCTTISLEIIIIHSFQAIYGYAYFQLTLIMTGFMIGLACGSWISLRHLSSTQLGIARFAYFQLWLTSYPIVAYLFFLFLLQISLPSVLVQLIFLTLIIGLGFIGGYQFPLANSIIYRQRSKIDSVSGTIYAWDLFGAVIGALLTSTFVIPVFGLTSAIFSFAILNFVIFALLILVKKLN